MTKLGMDAGEVRRFAGQLDAQAIRIQQIVAAVDGLVRLADAHWHGANGQRFHADWHGRERAQLLRAHDSIAGLAESARNNANDQATVSSADRRASGTPGGRPPGQAGGTGLLGLVSSVGAFLGGASAVIGLPEIPGKWAAAFNSSGSAAWASVGKRITRWESGVGSGITHAVREAGMSAKTLAELKGVGRVVGETGSVLGGISAAASGAEAVADFRSGHSSEGVYDTADTVGSALKSAKSPIPYLAGVAVATWTDDARMAQNIEWDWKWTSSINSHNWSDIVFGGAWDGLKQFPAHLFKDLT